MKSFCLIMALFFLTIKDATASIYSQYSLGYDSEKASLSSSNSSYSRMQNILFFGANVDTKKKLIFGWNFYLWSRSQVSGTAGTTDKVALTELGPRITYFFNDERNFYLSTAIHPYVKGTVTGTTSEKVSGSGYFASVGYQLKCSRSIYFGASLNYQSTSLDKSTVGTTESTVSYKYTFIYPLIEISMRFR